MTASMTGAAARDRRWRIKWGRVVFWLVAADVAGTLIWSGEHYLALKQQQAVLRQQIVIVEAQSQALRHEVADLQNPVTLKQILTGREKLPNPLWVTK